MMSPAILKDKFKDVLPIISKFAPSIASAIGGPFGMAAGYIIPILANAFGTNPGDINGIVHQLMNDPMAESKLEDLEHEHGDWLCTLTQSVSNLVKANINISLEWQPDSK